jgi:hypothetical protein
MPSSCHYTSLLFYTVEVTTYLLTGPRIPEYCGIMAEKCYCGLNLADAARGTPYRDPGFLKIICAKCGKVIYSDIKGKTLCFECEK